MGLTDKALVAPTESEAQRIEATYKDYGEGIVIIDGDDDWGADPIFRVRGVLKKAGVEALGGFHTGSSGVTESGAVIRSMDFPKFAEWVGANAPDYPDPEGRVRSRLRYYDRDAGMWVILAQKGFQKPQG